MRTIRSIRVEGSICVIPLSQGKEAVCDVADYMTVSGHNWCAYRRGRTFYATTGVYLGPHHYSKVDMHRFLLGLTSSSIEADHKDGDGLNNRRSNLRSCSCAENLRNKKLQLNSSSGFKGVSWHRYKRKWRAYINISNKQKSLGYFGTKEEAAQAYNEASRRYHQSFGRVNEEVFR